MLPVLDGIPAPVKQNIERGKPELQYRTDQWSVQFVGVGTPRRASERRPAAGSVVPTHRTMPSQNTCTAPRRAAPPPTPSRRSPSTPTASTYARYVVESDAWSANEQAARRARVARRAVRARLSSREPRERAYASTSTFRLNDYPTWALPQVCICMYGRIL